MVGTVIDPELRDEVRVTVIVTGLGRKQTSGGSRPDSTDNTKTDESFDYHQLDKPAIMRKHTPILNNPTSTKSTTEAQVSIKPLVNTHHHQEFDYLDIPAFLRRKEELVD